MSAGDVMNIDRGSGMHHVNKRPGPSNPASAIVLGFLYGPPTAKMAPWGPGVISFVVSKRSSGTPPGQSPRCDFSDAPFNITLCFLLGRCFLVGPNQDVCLGMCLFEVTYFHTYAYGCVI